MVIAVGRQSFYLDSSTKVEWVVGKVVSKGWVVEWPPRAIIISVIIVITVIEVRAWSRVEWVKCVPIGADIVDQLTTLKHGVGSSF